MKLINKIFDLRGGPLLVAGFLYLFVSEVRRPLRKRTANKLERMKTTAVLSSASFVLMRLVLLPAMVWAAHISNRREIGINTRYKAPAPIKFLISVLLLDYGSYLWHRINHRIPLLWRFHLVHHSDPDLDLTTGLRFHFGEMITSVAFRGLTALLIGATPKQLLYYEILFEAATQFHHTNMKLPISVERALNQVFVTPRMHGIHHSIIKEEADSNYSVFLSIWDRLHNSAVLNIPQHKIDIGIPQYSGREALSVKDLLAAPFKKLKPWPKNMMTRARHPASHWDEDVLAE